MIPRFSTWIEVAVAPQEKRKEGKDLDDVVANRLADLAEKIELDGHGSRQAIYNSLKRVIDSVPQNNQQPQQSQQQGEQPAGPEAQMQEPQQVQQNPAMAQTMQVVK